MLFDSSRPTGSWVTAALIRSGALLMSRDVGAADASAHHMGAFDPELIEHCQLVGVASVIGKRPHRRMALAGVALVHGDDLEVVAEPLDRVDRAALPEFDLAADSSGRNK